MDEDEDITNGMLGPEMAASSQDSGPMSFDEEDMFGPQTQTKPRTNSNS